MAYRTTKVKSAAPRPTPSTTTAISGPTGLPPVFTESLPGSLKSSLTTNSDPGSKYLPQPLPGLTPHPSTELDPGSKYLPQPGVFPTRVGDALGIPRNPQMQPEGGSSPAPNIRGGMGAVEDLVTEATPPGESQLPTTFEDLFPQIKDLLMQPGFSQQLLGGMILEGYGNTPTSTQDQFAGAQDFFGDPTQSGDFYKQMEDFFTSMNMDPTQSTEFMERMRGLEGMTGADNPAMQFYSQHMLNRPDVSAEPGFGTYYDTAIERSLEDQQRASAARGSYGSTTAQDMEGRRIGELRADQANREADYNLKRLGEERAWEQLGGTLGLNASESQRGWAGTMGAITSAADAAERAVGMENINKAIAGTGAATGADAADLAKTIGGIESANLADLSEDRVMELLSNLTSGIDEQSADNLLGVLSGAATSQKLGKERVEAPIIAGMDASNLVTDLTGPGFGGIFDSTTDLMETLASFGLGTSKESMNQNDQGVQKFMQGLEVVMKALGMDVPGMGSMGSTGKPE